MKKEKLLYIYKINKLKNYLDKILQIVLNNNIENRDKRGGKNTMMVVTLMVVYIYIYQEFYKTNRVNQELRSNKKECGSKLCKPSCNIFQNLIRIERLMLEYNSTH